ncbi:hypothetical protein KX032_004207 [Escherichia coli]|nr:hypothetical protein [Escherichia coli]EKW2655681.1 hypothetical protein [Escherichia coli]
MWYREGTITFTQGSNTLVGVGTAWNVTANGVLPGMIVIGPDNKLYEIKRVTSDTNIVLSEPYTGETQSEVPCRIITTYEGDLTQFSARFTALMSRMSADSKSMRSWLTALDEVTIEREDGTEVTVKPLMQIVNEHNENVEWYKNNTDAIDAAGDKAREAAPVLPQRQKAPIPLEKKHLKRLKVHPLRHPHKVLQVRVQLLRKDLKRTQRPPKKRQQNQRL